MPGGATPSWPTSLRVLVGSLGLSSRSAVVLGELPISRDTWALSAVGGGSEILTGSFSWLWVVFFLLLS